jgi:hypothetical protein
VVLDNGSLRDLESEVEPFRHLEHRRIKSWTRPNIVVAFLDDLRQSRATHDWLKMAEAESVPAFVVSTYHT